MHSFFGFRRFGRSWFGGGIGGGTESGGGAYGQLQSHGVKCLTATRHRLLPGS